MVINILCSQLSRQNETNQTGFHDSALCCVGAVKNSLHIHSLPWELGVITLLTSLSILVFFFFFFFGGGGGQPGFFFYQKLQN